MKKLLTILCCLVTQISFAQDLSEQQYDDVMSLLSEGVGKAMYLNNECGIEIDKSHLQDVAKLFAFKEGMQMPESPDWSSIAMNAHVIYSDYAKQYPNGEKCEALEEGIGDVKHFIVSNHSLLQ